MAHPIFWPSKSFFYPIGNTPPVCLTEYLPPGQDADILLLGCGDARNILYTIYASNHDEQTEFKLDFTCCDWEPAVLARNILLWTFLADRDVETIGVELWDIYYHFMINSSALSLLTSQSSKLAELSHDLETWHASPYADFLKICTRYTLAELHRLWTTYAETRQWPQSRRNAFKRDFTSTMHDIGSKYKDAMIGFRNVGPLNMMAHSDLAQAREMYWSKGTMSPEPLAVRNATNVNPTFAFATNCEGFVAHYGTFPVAAFSIAPAYIKHKGTTSHLTSHANEGSIYGTMLSQFLAWCAAFRVCIVKKKNVVIRLVVGEALAACHALHSLTKNTGPIRNFPVNPWHASAFLLDSGDYIATGRTAPISFDVIDSSNLSDHTGMINVLSVAVPLLRHTPFATLNTETLLPFTSDPTRSVASRLCGDVTTLSALFGVLPIDFVSGFSPHSNVHELLAQAYSSDSQFLERLVWKKSSALGRSLEPLVIPDAELTRFLISVYSSMFSHEDVSLTLQSFDRANVRDNSAVHYTRESLALLISYLKTRIQTDWDKAIAALLSMIRAEKRYVLGSNYYNEFLCHLHLLGIHSEEHFLSSHPMLVANRHIGPIQSWRAHPPVVCILFEVSRNKLQPLYDPTMPGNPILVAGLLNLLEGFHEAYSALHIAFGSLGFEGDDEDCRAYIIEDPLGKQGASSLIVAFWVPTWVLAISPENTFATLFIQSTPYHSAFVRKLGIRSELYRAPLVDKTAIHIVRSLPVPMASPKSSIDCVQVNPANSTHQDHVSAATKVEAYEQSGSNSYSSGKLTIRQDVVGVKQAELAKPSTEVTVTAGGPCEILLHIGNDAAYRLYYAYPVSAEQAKLRIARKSSWVEVVAPLVEASGLSPNRFIVCGKDNSRTPWNIQRIFLDRMPVVDVSHKEAVKWLDVHLNMAFSDREKDMINRDDHPRPAMCEVKHTIMDLFRHVLDLKGEKIRTCVFGLPHASGEGIRTIIFVEKVVLDLASHSIIADGYVLPVRPSLLKNRRRELGALEAKAIARFACTKEEITEWEHLIPAFVERCRDWDHKDNCAYSGQTTTSLAAQEGEISICDCGRGKVSPSFRTRKEWAPFAPYVTRIAISPLFAVSYLEDVGKQFRDSFKEVDKEGTLPTNRLANQPKQIVKCYNCDRALPRDKPILRCSKCKKATYCDQTCQTADWKKHKKECAAA
ncbi:hypothetical protein BDW22DRAFT_823484 [Trametopsis cervina]|nr:hypothetical protein BDW22DRAFT_823484 [Trametopsis cervina]